MNRLRLIFLLLAVVVAQIALADKGDKWRVSDQDLSVWSSPDYLSKLGTIHRGYEIIEKGIDGDMIQFDYNGQTAYVATYCCERVVDETVQHETIEEAASATSQSHTPSVKAGNVNPAKVEVAECGDNDGKTEKLSAGGVGLSVFLLIFGLVGMCIGLVAFVFTIFYVFKYKSLAAWFNRKCEAEVIPDKRMNSLLWPPVISALAMAILGGGINYVIMMAAADNDGWQAPLFVLGILLTLAIPFFVLRHVYLKNKRQYGRKAARWMMAYSLLSITAIYLCCVVIAYVVVGILALLLFAFILCVCFPTRYYIVRRW